MQKRILISSLFITLLCMSTWAQKLLKPFERISHKKSSYVFMEDGSEIEGTIKKLKRKKGLIKELNIKDENGKEMTIPIEDIKYAYLPQNGLDKAWKIFDFIGDATQWNDGLHDKDRIAEGYAVFEKTMVKVKKNKQVLLTQLLNPGTCERIKVYHNPWSSETAGLGVGGIKVTGGKDKSYYVSKDGAVAFKLQKKKYDDYFSDLFGECQSVKKDYENTKWNEFENALFAFNSDCEK